jgi:ribosomal protein L29
MGQAEALTKLRNLRKERARLLTILGERQVAREKAGA